LSSRSAILFKLPQLLSGVGEKVCYRRSLLTRGERERGAMQHAISGMNARHNSQMRGLGNVRSELTGVTVGVWWIAGHASRTRRVFSRRALATSHNPLNLQLGAPPWAATWGSCGAGRRPSIICGLPRLWPEAWARAKSRLGTGDRRHPPRESHKLAALGDGH
jgi:hypothetical protein